MNGAKVVGVVCVAWSMVVVASIVLSWTEMGLWEGLRTIAATKWGVTTLVDLYAGLAFVGAWIMLVERGRPRAIGWILALLLMGNLATLVYVALRAFRAANVRDVFMPAPAR